MPASWVRSKVWGEIVLGESIDAVRLDAYGQSPCPDHEPSRIDAMRRVACVPVDAVHGAAQQLHCSHGIAPPGVCEANG